MSVFKKDKVLNFGAKQIYDLVMDIESYPEFLPWCRRAQIVEVVSESRLEADLLINFKGFSEKYRSDVRFFRENSAYVIETRAIKGPFRHLFSRWNISEINKGSCLAKFEIDFVFNSLILDKMIGLVFERAANKMVDAFEGRARLIYG